jgi:thiamine-phosphate pyrophosphorylase
LLAGEECLRFRMRDGRNRRAEHKAMANAADPMTCRLCLVTPPDYDAASMTQRLADALAGGDVASLIVTAPGGNAEALQDAAAALVPIAQARGVATILHGDARIADRTKADGIHVDSGPDNLRAAIERRGRQIVGAGGLRSRHDALAAGELEPDYVFFGRLHGDDDEGIFPKALDLAAWWAEVAVIPAIVMGGRGLASVEEAAANGIDFVALSAAVWDNAEGPAGAVAEANRRLATMREAAE